MLLEQYVFQIWSWSIFNLEYSSRLLMVQDHKVLVLWSWTINRGQNVTKAAPRPFLFVVEYRLAQTVTMHWLLPVASLFLGALCYCELGTMIPKSGGEFAYFLETYGGMIAFGYSWMSSFILKPAVAVVILACAEYMVQPFYENTGCGAPLIAVKLFAICITGMYSLLQLFT